MTMCSDDLFREFGRELTTFLLGIGLEATTKEDLRGLLDTLINSWNDKREKHCLTRLCRAYLFELRWIANERAHAPVEGFSNEEDYRHLDTLERLGASIRVSGELTARIRGAKAALLDGLVKQVRGDTDIQRAPSFGLTVSAALLTVIDDQWQNWKEIKQKAAEQFPGRKYADNYVQSCLRNLANAGEIEADRRGCYRRSRPGV